MEELEKKTVQLISRLVEEKLGGRLSPLWYERLYSLPAEAKSKRDLKILALAIHYAMLRDVRSVRYIETCFSTGRNMECPPAGY